MLFEEFKERFIEWSISSIEKGICPFAKKARLENKIQFLDWSENENEQFDQDNYQIAIAWTDDRIVNIPHTESLYYFTSTKDSGYFAKNFTNCVFIQKKNDIDEKRTMLHDIGYYDNWPREYYEEIIHS